MNPYLECLYNYIEEHQFRPSSPYTKEYRSVAREEEQARLALEATFSPEQSELWARYQIAFSRILTLENDVLFENAVALGKWMILS